MQLKAHYMTHEGTKSKASSSSSSSPHPHNHHHDGPQSGGTDALLARLLPAAVLAAGAVVGPPAGPVDGEAVAAVPAARVGGREDAAAAAVTKSTT